VLLLLLKVPFASRLEVKNLNCVSSRTNSEVTVINAVTNRLMRCTAEALEAFLAESTAPFRFSVPGCEEEVPATPGLPTPSESAEGFSVVEYLNTKQTENVKLFRWYSVIKISWQL
jgi:hypothetical protein